MQNRVLLCHGLHKGLLSFPPSASILAVHSEAYLSPTELPGSISPWEEAPSSCTITRMTPAPAARPPSEGMLVEP